MDDSPIAAPPDGWFSENLLGHFQTGPNGRIHLELDVARKVHATFGEVGRFNRVFNGIAPSSLRSLTGTFSVKRAVVLSLVYMNPPANQLVRTEGGFQILPKVGAELS
jgi:hypothetical protein